MTNSDISLVLYVTSHITNIKHELEKRKRILTLPVITVRNIDQAVKLLNKGKSDGNLGLNSNHLINGGNKLYVLVSLLFNAMIVYSYTPEIMLKSTIISIPKNVRVNLTDSDNYRGITLCSSLCQVLDLLFINMNPDVKKSSDLQYAFKQGHSTNMCTLIIKEIIAHYIARGSEVYSCFIDASKAFDKINVAQLFKLLLKRDISASFLCLLLDTYERQQITAKWEDIRSFLFNRSKGVRQGRILSPLLFNIYIDELLYTLIKNGTGCYFGKHFVGAFGFADYITLLCPSRSGLQNMLLICGSFGKEFNVTYNPLKKSL